MKKEATKCYRGLLCSTRPLEHSLSLNCRKIMKLSHREVLPHHALVVTLSAIVITALQDGTGCQTPQGADFASPLKGHEPLKKVVCVPRTYLHMCQGTYMSLKRYLQWVRVRLISRCNL